jgi:RND superfamily putative drug exporter
LGFGLVMAAAVAIDATIVRCLLVPAVMSIIDRAALKLPAWLDRMLPHVSIEGEEWFARRDQDRARYHAAQATTEAATAARSLERVP